LGLGSRLGGADQDRRASARADLAGRRIGPLTPPSPAGAPGRPGAFSFGGGSQSRWTAVGLRTRLRLRPLAQRVWAEYRLLTRSTPALTWVEADRCGSSPG